MGAPHFFAGYGYRYFSLPCVSAGPLGPFALLYSGVFCRVLADSSISLPLCASCQVSQLLRPSVKDSASSHEHCLVLEDTAERFPCIFLSFPNEKVRAGYALVSGACRCGRRASVALAACRRTQVNWPGAFKARQLRLHQCAIRM